MDHVRENLAPEIPRIIVRIIGFNQEAPMSASIHEKLSRVRKPRVHIKYEVETEGA